MENRVTAVRDYGDELGPDLKPLDDLRLGGVRASDTARARRASRGMTTPA